MREIKFRAWWHTDTPDYYRGKRTNPDKMLQVGDDCGTKHPLDCCVYACQGQSVILMQFTGLKDKNGKEIYEGDLLLVRLQDYGCPKVDVFQVIWNTTNARFKLTDRNGDPWGFDDTNSMEVIGNIYENPELLEAR